MITLQRGAKISEEALLSSLRRQRIIPQRFKLDVDYEQALELITKAYIYEVSRRHMEYSDSIDVCNYIDEAAKWLTTDDKFGLFLCGKTGNGKTTLMRAIYDIVNMRINIKDPMFGVNFMSAKDIAKLENLTNVVRTDFLCVDDLGDEPAEVMSYGNISSPMVDLISKRYDGQLCTVITTNLTAKQIRERYGDRIADRLNEMMKVIIFKNDTYRK